LRGNQVGQAVAKQAAVIRDQNANDGQAATGEGYAIYGSGRWC